LVDRWLNIDPRIETSEVAGQRFLRLDTFVFIKTLSSLKSFIFIVKKIKKQNQEFPFIRYIMKLYSIIVDVIF